MHESIRLVFAGLVGLLLLASLAGALLRLRAGSGPSRAVVDSLNGRIRAWWLMALVIGGALWAGTVAVVLLFALVSFVVLREFLTLAPTRPGDHLALVASFYLILPLQYLLVGMGWFGLFPLVIPVYAFLFLPILSALSGDIRNLQARAAQTQWGLMLAVYCVSYVPAILFLPLPGHGGSAPLLLIFLTVVVQSGDVLQYLWNILRGRHLIAPQLSETRTVEGFLGGMACTTALGTGLWWITPFSPLAAAGMTLAISLMGYLGGLVMSAIKRDHGIRHWGQTEQGSMLDRMASVCFAAPVFFHLVRHFY
ncbi:MAG: phosphatidate cytidylyltransferase [Rhodocyclaceae bacterium]|nr:phosphatidate cytidylyltransferase [Rhodocyclaceae bacterium]